MPTIAFLFFVGESMKNQKIELRSSLDRLGRIIIPEYLLLQFDLKKGDCVELIPDNGKIKLRKAEKPIK